MAYDIDNDIEYAEARLKFLKAAKIKYPDMRQVSIGGQDIYVSDTAMPDCTEVAVFTKDGESILLPYTVLEDSRVYGWSGISVHSTSLWSALDALKTKSPSAYKTLVDIVRWKA